MKVLNIHERSFDKPADEVGALIDSLASRADKLWPRGSWPPMKFDRNLAVGPAGGHGPIRYVVEEYIPRRSIRFRFTRPKGFEGFHGFEVIPNAEGSTVLRHILEMNAGGVPFLTWPLVFRPMHDACVEDSLATAQAALGQTPDVRAWSPWVKCLRWLLSRGKAGNQITPERLA